jgi:hypothetical protein
LLARGDESDESLKVRSKVVKWKIEYKHKRREKSEKENSCKKKIENETVEIEKVIDDELRLGREWQIESQRRQQKRIQR